MDTYLQKPSNLVLERVLARAIADELYRGLDFGIMEVIAVPMSTRIRVSDELQKHLFLDDIRDYHPQYDPYVFIARSLLKRQSFDQAQGEIREFTGVKAFLVLTEQKDLAMDKFSYEKFNYEGRSYFDDDGRYNTGEMFERNGINFEIIVNDRSFEGLNLSYYEPTGRLVVYLNLHREGNRWINPYTKDGIIQTGDMTRGWAPHNAYLSIRKSELVDYLAARRCGLLLLRYSERMLETPVELLGLPKPFNDKPTMYGRQSWIVDKSSLKPDNYMYFSRLWESFWIDPASRPRRWDARSPAEFKDGVSFVLSNGELAIYKQGEKNRYFDLLSFKPTVTRSFLSMPNNRIEFSCLSNLSLHYADASYLLGCINREGQFQAFFGPVAKLDIEKQRQLAGFSEPQKAKPSYEYIRTCIEAKFPETMPFNWTLFSCLMDVNFPWEKKFGETLLLSPARNDIPILTLIGPTSDDFDELADVMLELQKTLIPESKIENIKNQLDYASLASNLETYEKMRCIGFTRLFFRANRSDQKDGESYILNVVNQLRNCKGHPKDVNRVFKEFSIPATAPRASFLYIMAELCNFLLAFKTLTEKVLGVTVGVSREKGANPFTQLQVARKYFLSPF